jgi:tetratricopeptide (TPR) repeat protein
MMSFNSRARHSLAQQVHHRGHLEEAERLLETAMRTGPFEHWETNDAARLLGEVLSERDPAAAAQLWDRHMFADLRVAYNFLDVESYVRFPFLVHKERAKAAAAAGNFDAARDEGRWAWMASPSDVRLAEDLVPLLDKAHRREDADQLFDQTFASLSAIIADYPDSAFHRNNLAWVAARCHRRLDEALLHAQQAVKLAPDSASYLDTLAEVHFHRGNRDEAIRLSQQALQLSPRYKTFQEQLTRFQNESLPK